MTSSSTIPTAATPDVCTFAVRVDGSEIPSQYHVLSITVVRELNRIPTATIHIKDGEASLQTFAASDTELFIPVPLPAVGQRGRLDKYTRPRFTSNDATPEEVHP